MRPGRGGSAAYPTRTNTHVLCVRDVGRTRTHGTNRISLDRITAMTVILVSNRQPVALPNVRAAVSLADLARAAGWHVRVGYALAAVPAHRYLNGNEARAAHEVATVMVAFRRPGRGAGRALWELCSDWPTTPTGRPAGWRFAYAYLGTEKTNLAQLREGIIYECQ